MEYPRLAAEVIKNEASKVYLEFLVEKLFIEEKR
jgi:hypothetical protein